jgi:hypothetical protein
MKVNVELADVKSVGMDSLAPLSPRHQPAGPPPKKARTDKGIYPVLLLHLSSTTRTSHN